MGATSTIAPHLGAHLAGRGGVTAPRAHRACASRPCRVQRAAAWERRVRGCRGDWNTTWRPEGSAGSGAGSGPAAHPPIPSPAGRRGMQSKGYRNEVFQRDGQPENIIIKQNTLKLRDFGSCMSIYSQQAHRSRILSFESSL
ncbi:MAPK/MAK/MRK overlapping kinase [Corvus moneduloides]|uniref:MAPK/MAK/MRK overlapping kinase n=1 Tax=Corvus moneduloides TaxID=1196302 RepID=UPI001363935E|nr:MAPK/MAK/MRK overlapping kinase [Corvus moneduloides]